MYAISLLDKALQKFGSDRQTALAAGVSQQAISKIRHGAKMSPELAAIVAAALGDDPDYAVKRVMLDNADPGLHARLTKAFRVAAGVAGVAVLAATVSDHGSAHAGTIKPDREHLHGQPLVDSRYIVDINGSLNAGGTQGRWPLVKGCLGAASVTSVSRRRVPRLIVCIGRIMKSVPRTLGLLLLAASTAALSQIKPDGLPASRPAGAEGSSTLDLLIDLAASAPTATARVQGNPDDAKRADRPESPSSKGAPTTAPAADVEPTQSSLTRTLQDSALAISPLPPAADQARHAASLEDPPTNTRSGVGPGQSGGSTDAAVVRYQDGADEGDSWLRSTVRYLREHRGIVLAVAAFGLLVTIGLTWLMSSAGARRSQTSHRVVGQDAKKRSGAVNPAAHGGSVRPRTLRRHRHRR